LQFIAVLSASQSLAKLPKKLSEHSLPIKLQTNKKKAYCKRRSSLRFGENFFSVFFLLLAFEKEKFV
jgi:hypothetical protein